MEVAPNVRIGTRSLRHAMPLVWALVFALLLLGVILRAPIERAVALTVLRQATALEIDGADLTNVPGGFALSDVRARSAQGDLTLLAPRLVVTKTGTGLEAELDGAQVTAVAGSYATPLEHAGSYARRMLLGSGAIALRLEDGSLLLKG